MDLPSYHNNLSSPSFVELKEDHTSSSLSLSYPHHAFMNPAQDQGNFFYRSETQRFQLQAADHKKMNVSSGGSSYDHHHHPRAEESHESFHNHHDLKLSITTTAAVAIAEDHINYDMKNHTSHEENINSVKWMSSKMRMMRKMITNSDQTASNDTPTNFTTTPQNFEPPPPLPVMKINIKHPGSPPGSTDHSTSSSSNNNATIIRVCSDCNTTKTPLWRSGPRGPKSLCNACGIRQRKARRAMAAAAAAANGTVVPVDAPSMKNSAKAQQKEKKSRVGGGDDNRCVPFKKRCKLPSPSRGRRKNKLCFEDLIVSVSKNTTAFQRVFPQDERDAAILLMALSYGLVHG
ncbi:GATA transcription factor 21 [Humulus lupulus]|uniref:GATA transcription factor 21 n=1 Tax=Humulus lupulus TaxID=3486 RepID=UPI002B4061FA|nr:GATA transcription factor 21 [Humulus lupulus]